MASNNYDYREHIAEYQAENPSGHPIQIKLKESQRKEPLPANATITTIKRTVDRRNGCVMLETVLPVKGYVAYALDPAVRGHYSAEAIERKSPWKLLKMHTIDTWPTVGVHVDGLHFTRRYKRLLSMTHWINEISNCLPPDCRVLYHQTSPSSADKIVADRMLRGSGGTAGGGIYFACSEREAQVKALHSGALLRCVVYVGRQLEIPFSSVSSQNFQQLRADGYDSVRTHGRDTGVEHVVYNHDQVLKIDRLS